MTIDAKRLEEVKEAARARAPQANPEECAAALLVVVFDPRIREHVKRTQPRLWEQIQHALGPLTTPVEPEAAEEPEAAPPAVVKVPPLTRGKRARGEPKPEAPPDDVAGGI